MTQPSPFRHHPLRSRDFSPPASPSLDEQRDALQKGLGRAVQWARAGLLADDALLDACLIEQRYDTWVEDSRTEWLWQMIEMLGAQDRFRVPLLHALHDLAEERSAYQLCELGCRYAQTGDDAFRTRLYQIVESRPFADAPLLGDAELLRLDGCRALTFVARVRGDELSQREWDWHDGSFINEAIDLLGEGEVRNALDKAHEAGVLRFRERWAQEASQPQQQQVPTREQQMRSLSANDILAEARKARPSLATFRGWGIHAADSDLKPIVARLWKATESTEIVSLLRVLAKRALPSFDPRLIELCRHSDANVRHWAFNALENNSDPAIREFAFGLLQDADRYAIGLLVNNFERGDERTILEQLQVPSDPFEVHSILFDLVKLLESNDDADASRLGVIAYAITPCETCRLCAARHLRKQRAAPDWLIAECRFDCVEDCRTPGENEKPASADEKA